MTGNQTRHSADWQPLRFDQICIRRSEGYQPVDGGTQPYIGLEHIQQGLPALKAIGTESDVCSGKSKFQSKDVLFGKLRPYLRKAVIPGFAGVCSTDILVFTALEDTVPEYLLYLCHSDQFIKHAKATTTGVQHPRTSWPSLAEFRWNVPVKNEQCQIARVLATVQRAIEQQQAIIATTRELKRSVMHTLFTEGLRGEAQKATEIGLVPESWEPVAIGNLGRCVTGSTPKTTVPEYYDPPEVAFIAPADIGFTREISKSEKRISSQGLATVRQIPAGSVMCVCIGSSIGKVGVATTTPSATNQQINSVIPTEKYSSNYLHYLLSYHAQCWRGHATFGPVPILSKGRFESIKLYVSPDKLERDEIGEMLAAVDDTIESRHLKVDCLSELFKTLLHQLMTAQVRVHDLDLDALGVPALD